MIIFNDLPLEEKAKIIAEIAHFGQRYGDFDYMYHLEQVVDELKSYDAPDYLLAAAYLHDVLEDTTIKPKLLLKHFGEKITGIVLSVTNSLDISAKNKLVSTYTKMYKDPDAIQLKLADRICNMSMSINGKNKKMLTKYVDVYPFFKEMLDDGEYNQLMWRKLGNIVIAAKNILNQLKEKESNVMMSYENVEQNID